MQKRFVFMTFCWCWFIWIRLKIIRQTALYTAIVTVCVKNPGTICWIKKLEMERQNWKVEVFLENELEKTSQLLV